jgi:hypothetical protein
MQLITAVARREKTTTTARSGNGALFISLQTVAVVFVVVELSSLLSGWQETPRRTLDDARAKWRA